MKFLEPKLHAFLSKYGMRFVHGPQSFISDCPSCGKESHLYIRKDDGQTICFKCGGKWNWRGLVAIVARCSLQEAYYVLFGRGAGDQLDGLNIDFVDPRGAHSDDEEMTDNPILLPFDFIPVEDSEIGMEYLRFRKIDESLIPKYNIKYHAPMNAVVFPIFMDGAVYGWQARRIAPKDGEIRLITSKKFKKANFLLNYDRAKKSKSIILTEGPFDCLHVDVDGHGAVCSFGKLISLQQIKLILDSDAENVYLGLDDDAAIQVYQVLSKIGEKKKVFRMRPPKHREDFGEATADEVRDAIRMAQPLLNSVSLLEIHFK